MSLIDIVQLTFGYEGSYDTIFEQVSFQIDTNWKTGLIARNGKGKTTFLKLLQNQFEFFGVIRKSIEVDYFPYEIHDKKRTTLEIIEQICPAYEFWKICRELNLLFLDCDLLYREFETLSNGEQTKIMLAVLFSTESKFLLIDEPTNHLDLEARAIVKKYLSEKSGFILVSHDRDFLDGCIDHVLSINKNTIEVVQGNFSSWWENKRNKELFEQAENEKLKKEIVKLSQSAKKTLAWADKIESSKIGFDPRKEERNISSRSYIAEKSKRMQQRRKNLERRQNNAIEKKSLLLKDQEVVENLKIEPLIYHKQILVEIKNGSIRYHDQDVCSNLNFKIERGDRVILQGKNGCGKSSLIKRILGDNIPFFGELVVGSGVLISYVSQDTSFLKGSLAEFIAEQELNESLFKAILRKLDFSRTQFDKKLEELSSGQKKKLLLAKSFCDPAHLYIWDEPLNYIDVFSRIQIEELILNFKPTMLFVEHDKVFADKIATHHIMME